MQNMLIRKVERIKIVKKGHPGEGYPARSAGCSRRGAESCRHDMMITQSRTKMKEPLTIDELLEVMHELSSRFEKMIKETEGDKKLANILMNADDPDSRFKAKIYAGYD